MFSRQSGLYCQFCLSEHAQLIFQQSRTANFRKDVNVRHKMAMRDELGFMKDFVRQELIHQ